MTARVVQCPGCGATIDAPPDATQTTCAYCGARLEVAIGASGAPLARISEIQADTSFLAKDRARAHLRDKLNNIDAQMDSLMERAVENRERERVRIARLRIQLGLIVLVIFWVLNVGNSFLYGILAGSAAAGAVTFVGRRRVEKIERFYLDRLRPLQESRRELAEELHRLETEIDQIARQFVSR